VVIPLLRQQQETAIGFLVVGLNPFRQFDTDYQGFVDLIAGQIVAGISNARAFEEERRRAEALAEIDRAKTAFFTNISHEFRTPLTLMLGPLEDMTSDHTGPTTMSAEDRAQLGLIYRNATRLLRLVNALLDFSRIEAGHASASYRPVDLALFTRDLASAFRPATDKAGLQLLVECELTRGPVAVDQDMWEKILLNLLSNAFKFTFNGQIKVRLYEDPSTNSVCLEVSDTGIGIRREELPHLFERFHRVQDATGRSFEGTGIGLALIKELVGLHDGVISVLSEEGRGSTFTVVIPRRSDWLASSVSSDNSHRTSHAPAIDYLEQALRWFPSGPENGEASSLSLDIGAAETSVPRTRVLLADDNADMRAYLSRLLGQHYEVLAVTNGREALFEALAHPPDLVLTDVMMPELDGFELLQGLRSEPTTRTVPVIMVSARAGEEANVGGLQAGADDYLIKPFSARELLARVRTQLQLRQRLAQFETLVKQAPIGIVVVDSGFRIRQVNPIARPVFGDIPGLIGRDFREVMRSLWRPEYAEEVVQIFRRTMETGEPYSTPKRTEYRIDRHQPEYYEWRVDRIAMPEDGYGVVCYFRDISMQVKAEEALRKSEKLAAVGRLASTISHEINNPLEAVTNLLYIVGGLSTEEPVREYIRTAERELQRASEVVRHSLKFHRQATKPEPELISDLLRSTLTVYESRFRQANIETCTEFRDRVPVLCFGSELRQVFANLVGNAFDAMRSGCTLTIRTREAVEVRTGKSGIRVTIADNGSGMSAETQRRLYEPFFTTKGMNGTGLGLWVSSEILRRHGAGLRLKSSQLPPGNGTVFSLFLPADGPLHFSRQDTDQ
jgi:PAS domain S-box-containing protein